MTANTPSPRQARLALLASLAEKSTKREYGNFNFPKCWKQRTTFNSFFFVALRIIRLLTLVSSTRDGIIPRKELLTTKSFPYTDVIHGLRADFFSSLESSLYFLEHSVPDSGGDWWGNFLLCFLDFLLDLVFDSLDFFFFSNSASCFPSTNEFHSRKYIEYSP